MPATQQITFTVTPQANVSTQLAPANPGRRMMWITNNDPNFNAYIGFGTNNAATVGMHMIPPSTSVGFDNLLREGMGGQAMAVNLFEGDVAVIMPQITSPLVSPGTQITMAAIAYTEA